MKDGTRTAIAALSIIVYVICFIISIGLTKGAAGSWVPMAFLSVLFIFLFSIGAAMISGRGGFMLAGWNTMTPEERTHYDEKLILRSAGIMIILFTVGIVFSMLSFTNDLPWLGWILVILSLVGLFVGAVRMGRKGKIYSV
ncbi:MAG TPA: DUF3784 domain-containing protein [Methanomassiliicoccales archaeon]|jgi:hypothetical protein